MRRLIVIALLVACSAKDKPVSDKPGECLPLPSTTRRNLVADPTGTALYWIEQASIYDFDSALRTHTYLIRFDLATRRREIVIDYADAPLLFMRDKLIAMRMMGSRLAVAIIDRDGHIQTITPDYLEAADVEPIDDHTLAVLADGDGKRAVYTIDLDRQRPHHLIDADVLLSTMGGNVYVNASSEGIMIDPATGKREPFVLQPDSTPQQDTALYVQDSMVRARPMLGGTERKLVSSRDSWKLVHQPGSVLARTPPKNEVSYAWLIKPTGVTELPRVRGGASIISTAEVKGQTWALIGHNTANFVGDLGDIEPEADICLLPTTPDVTFATRAVPARYAAVEAKLYETVAKVAPGATMQVIDNTTAPTTVYYEVPQDAGSHFDLMRKKARDLHQQVSSVLGDREAMTEVMFADGRHSIQRWRRTRLRKRTSVGMGDALLSEPADFDAEIRDLVNERAEKGIKCAGTLVNTQNRKVDNVVIRCSTNRSKVIRVAEIAALGTHAFSHTFPLDDEDDDDPFFEVFRDREPLEVRDAAAEARAQRVFAVAAAAYDESELALISHKAEGHLVSVTVLAPRGFELRDEDEQRTAAAAAFRHYEGLRAIYEVAKTTPLTLRIEVKVSSQIYDFDGTELTEGE